MVGVSALLFDIGVFVLDFVLAIIVAASTLLSISTILLKEIIYRTIRGPN